MTAIRIKAWLLLYYFSFFVFMLIPFISVLLGGIPFNKPVNATYISGFVTANGVFLGFLTSVLINRRDTLETLLKFEISVDLVYFAGALYAVFLFALLDEPNVITLTVVMSSLWLTIGTAISVINKLRLEKGIKKREKSP